MPGVEPNVGLVKDMELSLNALERDTESLISDMALLKLNVGVIALDIRSQTGSSRQSWSTKGDIASLKSEIESLKSTILSTERQVNRR